MKLIQAEGTLIISSFCKNQRETVVIRLSKYLGSIKEKYFQIHFPLATARCRMNTVVSVPHQGPSFSLPSYFRSVLDT